MREVWEALCSGREPGILVCDFDGTLTSSGSSMHAAARLLGPEAEFTRERDVLYQKYGWLRLAEGRKGACEKAAEEWWTGQMELYIRFCIRQELLLEAARSLPPRKGCTELLQKCLECKIPVWIVSAGIANVIEYWLPGQGLDSRKFHIVANRIFYDKERPSGYSPVVTTWNKPERFFQNTGPGLRQKLVFLGNHPRDVGWREENSESILLENVK